LGLRAWLWVDMITSQKRLQGLGGSSVVPRPTFCLECSLEAMAKPGAFFFNISGVELGHVRKKDR